MEVVVSIESMESSKRCLTQSETFDSQLGYSSSVIWMIENIIITLIILSIGEGFCFIWYYSIDALLLSKELWVVRVETEGRSRPHLPNVSSFYNITFKFESTCCKFNLTDSQRGTQKSGKCQLNKMRLGWSESSEGISISRHWGHGWTSHPTLEAVCGQPHLSYWSRPCVLTWVGDNAISVPSRSAAGDCLFFLYGNPIEIVFFSAQNVKKLPAAPQFFHFFKKN